ncbi:long-chain-fatty-acid--CoA ligase ACSBG2-like [Peromyscus leucopus]|uniref:long-chain-fatty-acid--CoA ligase ACSBG2-like n=1 Tax=Peromyscus leucopus TaxID=10041 RepID=UPI0018853CC5|nr:long-chain-fatty-acid--CoA ligase ACSBG2-like [Peromyscus leucopus]XP_037053743.1 long-chain-fatty-acid--CoA ligase ACSBG2-like [Peromyscus leucopus]
MSDPNEQNGAGGAKPLLTAKTILKTKLYSKALKRTTPQAPHPSETMAPGSCYWTAERDGEVKLRLGKNSEDEPPTTVPDLIMSAATKYSHCLAIGSKYKKSWQLLTYIEYYEACRRAAKAFLKVGLERFHGVGIMGFNSTEWVIANIGAIMAGGISVGILCSNSPKVCQVIAEASEMDIFVVDNDRQLQKVNQIQGYLKHLKAIIQYREDIQEVQPNLYSWKGFLDLADGISDEKLDQVIDSQKPNQCCALVYNQGTTGAPKAIMLSHDNITWTTAATVQSLEFKCPPDGQEIFVSYLPLCFAGAQILDVWVAISVAATVYFPSAEAGNWSGPARAPGTGFLTEMLREVQPTTFCGIPWVWDRMLDSLQTKHLDATAFRRRIDRWAMRMGLSTNRRRLLGQIHQPLCFGLAKKLTFDPARKFLGLNHCQQFLNMGSGLPRATVDFFLSLDIPIFEAYGLSECTGLHTVSSQQAFRLPSSGKALPSSHTKVEKENQDGVGNLCVWGRHIFMGYLNDKEATEKKVDSHGWLHTNDLGFLDIDKFLYVMGNINDMITLSSGEVINPNPIEERVKMRIPIVRYVMVVGQDAPYLCALLTMKCQINPETGEARSALTSEVVACCRKMRSQSTWLADVLYNRDPLVTEFINQGIQDVNAEAPSEGTKIIKWVILDNDFSVGGGELGPMSKLNRTTVAKIYQEEIQKFYERASSS